MRILCDMDGIVTDLLGKWINDYNRDYGDDLGIEGMLDPELHNWVKPQARDSIYEYINRDGYFRDLNPLPGAIGVLNTIISEGHDVYFVTSASHNPRSASDKIAWIGEHVGLDRRHVIPCSDKYLVKGDVFIDDTPKKIIDYRREWPSAHILSISYPYNKEADPFVDLMATGWDSTKRAWKSILDYITKLRKGL